MPPIKKPEWCFFVAAAMIFTGWAMLPAYLLRLYHLPILSGILKPIPYSPIIAEYGGYVLAIVFTYLATYPISRALQLYYPETFEAFESERDMAF